MEINISYYKVDCTLLYCMFLKLSNVYKVEFHIKYGWDQYLIDPDGGIKNLQKPTSSHRPGSESHKLLQCMPSQKDL